MLTFTLTRVYPLNTVGTAALSLSSHTVQELGDYKKSPALNVVHFKSNLLEYSAKTITNVSLSKYLNTALCM